MDSRIVKGGTPYPILSGASRRRAQIIYVRSYEFVDMEEF